MQDVALAARAKQRGPTSLLPPILGSTIRADDEFLHDLLPFAPWIVGVEDLAFAHVVGANEGVSHATVRVLLWARLKNNTLRSPRRDHALTQLTAKHEIEPIEVPLGVAQVLNGLYAPDGAEREKAPGRTSARADPNTHDKCEKKGVDSLTVGGATLAARSAARWLLGGCE